MVHDSKGRQDQKAGEAGLPIGESRARPTIATPVTSPPRRLLAASVGQYLSAAAPLVRISPSAVGNTEGTTWYLQDPNAIPFFVLCHICAFPAFCLLLPVTSSWCQFSAARLSLFDTSDRVCRHDLTISRRV